MKLNLSKPLRVGELREALKLFSDNTRLSFNVTVAGETSDDGEAVSISDSVIAGFPAAVIEVEWP